MVEQRRVVKRESLNREIEEVIRGEKRARKFNGLRFIFFKRYPEKRVAKDTAGKLRILTNCHVRIHYPNSKEAPDSAEIWVKRKGNNGNGDEK